MKYRSPIMLLHHRHEIVQPTAVVVAILLINYVISILCTYVYIYIYIKINITICTMRTSFSLPLTPVTCFFSFSFSSSPSLSYYFFFFVSEHEQQPQSERRTIITCIFLNYAYTGMVFFPAPPFSILVSKNSVLTFRRR